MKDDFLWLQKWYQARCNGNWEHDRRIHLGTIDNPGWSLTIDLEDTELENKNFQEINDIHRSEKDWTVCRVKNTKFEAYGGVENLPGILKVFRYWAENEPFDFELESTKITEKSMEEDDFSWLQQWYQDYCSRIHFRNIDNPGWSLTVGLEDTQLEYTNFQQIKIDRSEQDWIFCEVKDLKFEARCGVENLPEVLKIFRHWVIENEPSENNEYEWDDRVIIKKDAPEQFCPGRIGVVCYMWEIKFEDIAKEFCSELGDWIYLIKFKTGREIRVAGRFLEEYSEV
ncbi:MAG TPA: immunity 53 family protein [Candidatus Rhabdochlamydia sp.]|jgi:Immunity protein 53|nr:immunity 53 family protein [Candidatus Rhabdochlamydia sp.]